MANLADKIAVVTGGARGIGRATVLGLARAGADVAILDLDLEGAAVFGEALTAASVVGEIEVIGRRGLGVEADLADEVSVKRAFDTVVAKLGPVDILINIAGGAITPIDVSNPSSMTVRDIRKNFDVNYLTAVLCSQAVIPGMIARKSGAIVNTSTVGATMIAAGGRLSHYSSSKAAVAHLTRDLAAELGEYGIRVNAVAPGLIATARVKAQAAERDLASPSDAAMIPLRRLGEPDDIAGVVEFLAGDAARYITGQIVSVCGGLCMVPN